MRRTVLLTLATGLLSAAVLPASADAPSRTAWYTAVTVGPITAPAPTVAEGDLQVAGTGARPTAYAALALTAPPRAGGELVLAVRSMTGTPEVAACPTKATDWEAGGGQPFSAGPEYDCDAAAVLGTLSADGSSISFPLDSSLRSGDDPLSVALAPLPEGTAPFSIDLGDAAFTPEPAVPEDAAEEPAGQTQTPPDAAAGPDPGGAEAPTTSADAPAAALPEEPPALADAPALDLADEPLAPAVEPPVEPPLAADPGLPAAAGPEAVLPGARLAAARADDDPVGPRLLALLALVAVSAGAGYAAGQQRPAPRLLGGRARALPAGGTTAALEAGSPAPGTAVAVAAAPAVLPRGIGRFSRVRDTAPRRLR